MQALQRAQTGRQPVGGGCWPSPGARALHRIVSGIRGLDRLSSDPLRRDVLAHAVKYTELGSPGELRPKGKPDREADKAYGSKYELVTAATKWQEVRQLFSEIADDADRNYSLVGHMLMQLSRVVEGVELPLLERQDAMNAAKRMSVVVRNNADRYKAVMLSGLLWALAGLELRDQRTLEALVLALRSNMGRLMAGELFHALSALALLGYRPPSRTTDTARLAAAEAAAAAAEGLDTSSAGPKRGKRGKAAAAAAAAEAEAAAAMAERRPVRGLIEAVEARTARAMRFLNLQDVANASFSLSKLAAPGQMSQEWLEGFAEVAQPHLPMLRGEALSSTAYLLARQDFTPRQPWIMDFCRAVTTQLRSLGGRDFPMIIYSLARWRQAPPSKPWLDQLLAASYSSRALALLPVPELCAIVTSLAALPGVVVTPATASGSSSDGGIATAAAATPVSQLWLARLLPALSARVAEEGGEVAPKLLLNLLQGLTALGATPTAAWLDEMLAASQQGLPQLAPVQLLQLTAAVAAAGHAPDGIWTAALCAEVVGRLPTAAAEQVPLLLAATVALDVQPASTSDATESGTDDGARAAALSSVAAAFGGAGADRWREAAAKMPLSALAQAVAPLQQQQGLASSSSSSNSSRHSALAQAVQAVLEPWHARISGVSQLSLPELQAAAVDCAQQGSVPAGFVAGACEALQLRCKEEGAGQWRDLVAAVGALALLQNLQANAATSSNTTTSSSSSSSSSSSGGGAQASGLSAAAAAALRALVQRKQLKDGLEVLAAATAFRDEAGVQLDDVALEEIADLAGGEVTAEDWEVYDGPVAGSGSAVDGKEWWVGDGAAAGVAGGAGRAGGAGAGWEEQEQWRDYGRARASAGAAGRAGGAGAASRPAEEQWGGYGNAGAADWQAEGRQAPGGKAAGAGRSAGFGRQAEQQWGDESSRAVKHQAGPETEWWDGDDTAASTKGAAEEEWWDAGDDVAGSAAGAAGPAGDAWGSDGGWDAGAAAPGGDAWGGGAGSGDAMQQQSGGYGQEQYYTSSRKPRQQRQQW